MYKDNWKKNLRRQHILFPQTTPISITWRHLSYLNTLITNEDPILVKNMILMLETNKTTVSQIKNDLIKLCWVQERSIGLVHEVMLHPLRIGEVLSFLGVWQKMRRTIPVRPHAIRATTELLEAPKNLTDILEGISSSARVIISPMNNNKMYSIETEWGTVIIRPLSRKIRVDFQVEGFILPIQKEDVTHLEQYIQTYVKHRILHMHHFIRSHLQIRGVIVSNIIVLKGLDLGILFKENVAEVLKINKTLKDRGIFKDHSIYGTDEIETCGTLNEVVARIVPLLNEAFKHLESRFPEPEETKTRDESVTPNS